MTPTQKAVEEIKKKTTDFEIKRLEGLYQRRFNKIVLDEVRYDVRKHAFLTEAITLALEKGRELERQEFKKILDVLDKSHQEEIKKLMEKFKTKKMPKWVLPKKDCTFQGFIIVNGEIRAICDSVGDDVSRQFCEYCQYWTKVMKHKKWKPYKTAERMTRLFLKDFDWDDNLKQAIQSEHQKFQKKVKELEDGIKKEITDCCKDRFTIKMKKLDSGYSCATCDALERVLSLIKKVMGKEE